MKRKLVYPPDLSRRTQALTITIIMSGNKVALLVYRSMLRTARAMAREGKSFKIRNMNREYPEGGNFSLYSADRKWWQSELQEMLPGFVSGSEPVDGHFRGSTLADCVRENFR